MVSSAVIPTGQPSTSSTSRLPWKLDSLQGQCLTLKLQDRGQGESHKSYKAPYLVIGTDVSLECDEYQRSCLHVVQLQLLISESFHSFRSSVDLDKGYFKRIH